MYEMLYGYSPFKPRHDTSPNNNIIRNIKQVRYTFPDNVRVSEEAKDLIRRLLTFAPEQRLGFRGAAEVMAHPFFRTIVWDDLLYKRIEAPIKVKLSTKRRREV